jgi:hypothetical protein
VLANPNRTSCGVQPAADVSRRQPVKVVHLQQLPVTGIKPHRRGADSFGLGARCRLLVFTHADLGCADSESNGGVDGLP